MLSAPLTPARYDALHGSRDEPEDVCTNCDAPDFLAELATDYGTERLCPGCMAEALAPEVTSALPLPLAA